MQRRRIGVGVGDGIGIVHYALGFLGRHHPAERSSCSSLIENHFDADTEPDPDAEGGGYCDTASKAGIQEVRLPSRQ